MSAESIFHQAIYLTGPTASGKSAVGVALAQILNAEIIALDSMTLYRGLDIATAKPSLDERQGVSHHLIDVLEPWEAASVAAYRAWASDAIQAIHARGKRALFVGGTPLYLKALLRGLFEAPAANPELREQLEADAKNAGPAALHARLATLDPITAARLHPNDIRRIVRALEIATLTGQPISRLQAEHDQPAPAWVPVHALEIDRSNLHHRINARVLAFFERGLIHEVQRLRQLDPPLNPVAAQAIGYHEVMQMLDGNLDQNQAITTIQARTRQFAKRQATWFRGLSEVRPFPVAPGEDPAQTADRLAAELGPSV